MEIKSREEELKEYKKVCKHIEFCDFDDPYRWLKCNIGVRLGCDPASWFLTECYNNCYLVNKYTPDHMVHFEIKKDKKE